MSEQYHPEKVVELPPANPGEGESINSAQIEVYKDAAILTWNIDGQTAEIAPVSRAGTNNGWCTPEGFCTTVPDIFNVNGGDQDSPVIIKTVAGTFIAIVQGKLYAAPPRQDKRVFDMNQYFTDANPIIGRDWRIDRRDGGRPLIVKGVSQVGVMLSSRLQSVGVPLSRFPNQKHYSTGYSGDSIRVQQLVGGGYVPPSIKAHGFVR